MEQRELGNTGLKVSVLGFGGAAIGGLMTRGDPSDQTRAFRVALDAGITYFDTAPRYGQGRSEENFGRTLRELGARDGIVLGTKVRLSVADLSDPPTAIKRSCEASLRRLRVDAVDLLQLHNPVGLESSEADRSTIALAEVIGEVAEGLKAMRKQGLTRHIGFTALGETAALHQTAMAEDYETVQTYFNVLNPSAGFAGASGGAQDFEGLIDTATRAGLGVIAIRTFAAGALTATPERHAIAGDPGEPLTPGAEYDRDIERARGLASMVSELGLESTLELGLRFSLSEPGVATVMLGPATVEHIESDIRWADRGPLPRDVVSRLVELAG